MEKSIRKAPVVELDEIKAKIVECIKKEYGMTVKDFAYSDQAVKLKLNTRNLQNYLSKGATSLPTLNILCKHFGIGTLKRRVIVKRTEIYSLVKSDSNGKKGK